MISGRKESSLQLSVLQKERRQENPRPGRLRVVC